MSPNNTAKPLDEETTTSSTLPTSRHQDSQPNSPQQEKQEDGIDDDDDDDNNTSTTTATATTFVDYTPPSSAKVPPPAKYKLWLMIYVLVFGADWVSYESGYVEFLQFGGHLSPSTAFFLQLYSTLFCLIYTTLDIVKVCLSYRNQETDLVYGLEAWLRQSRMEWIYRYEGQVWADVLASLIVTLEDGFGMLDAPPSQQPPPPKPTAEPKRFSTPNSDCETVLKIEHRIQPDKVEEYRQWFQRIEHAANHANGLLKLETNNFKEEESDEEQGHTTKEDNTSRRKSCRHQSPSSHQRKSLLHVVYLHFANIHYLNDWMLTPRRNALMKDLVPLLETEDIVKVQNDRELPDAFTDLMARQGESVPSRPPKKWKVWWLTTLALYLTYQWTDHFMPYYLEHWGLDNEHRPLRQMVYLLASTFLNTYVMTPLLLFLFDHWITRPPEENDVDHEPWRTLNDGFASVWWKAVVTLVFYGGNLLAALVKNHVQL